MAGHGVIVPRANPPAGLKSLYKLAAEWQIPISEIAFEARRRHWTITWYQDSNNHILFAPPNWRDPND